MIYIVNPPQWTAAMPPVALPALAGYLEKENIPFSQIDFNIKFYNYILSSEFISKIICKFSGNEAENLYVDYLCENIDKAMENMRIEEKVLDEQCLYWSNKVIKEALKVINKCINPIKIELNSMSFGIKELNTYTDIFRVIDNQKYNVLIDIYSEIISRYEFKEDSIIGFSINNLSQMINSIFITKILRKKVKAHIYLGGSFISAHIEELVKCEELFDFFDSICVYDGEHALKSLNEYKYHGKNDIVKNIIFKENRELHKKSDYYIEDITKLPASNYEGLDFEEYMSPIRVVSLPISRGCYGSCRFCSYNHLASSKWREQTIKQVIEQIEECIEAYNTKYFFFSVATMAPKMAEELSKFIIEKKLNIKWASGIRMEKNFTEDLIKLMGKAGCVRLDIGIESANQDVLNNMDKRIESKYYIEKINYMYDNGIYPYLYTIKNFPQETVEQFKDTIDFIKEVKEKILGFSCYEYTLTPNTYVWEHLDEFEISINEKSGQCEDFIDRLDSIKWGIKDSEKFEKECLLNKFYEENKVLFKSYGESYLLRKMPISFQNQILYIDKDMVNSKKDICLELDDTFVLNKNIIKIDKSESKILIISLDTMRRLFINKEFYRQLEKCNSMTLKEFLKEVNVDNRSEKELINVMNKLYESKIIGKN